MADAIALALALKNHVNRELDKILLSARLVGVRAAYIPGDRGRSAGLQPRGMADDFFIGATIHIENEPLMGLLMFCCDQEVLRKVRIPGFNAEWRNFQLLGQEVINLVDSSGNPWRSVPFGPIRYTLYHSTGNDILQ